MKKIMYFFVIIIVIIAFIGIKYFNYKTDYNSTLKENLEYETYSDQEIYGNKLATLINRAINSNEQNEVEKDEKGLFIDNNKDSVRIEIYMTDTETTYKMETLYDGGIDNFMIYYGNIKFKCTKKEYHKSTHKIKYMLFEQISN